MTRTKTYCPRCKCVLRRKQKLMRIGVNRPIACAAQRCPKCHVWYPMARRMVYIRFRPVFDMAVAA